MFRDVDGPGARSMVVIPPGEFMMGSTETERQWPSHRAQSESMGRAEQPQHRVRIAYPLAVGRYPVTFAEYDHFAAPPGRRSQMMEAGAGAGGR